MKVAFFGTPEFAVPSLDAVLAAAEVAAVVTRPDAPRGRGLRVEPPPVARAASEYALDVLQPAGLRDPAFLDRLRAFGCDLIVVVAFGRLIPPEVLAIPPLGAVNLHPSLLPRYRGAAPVPRAIAAGETETGVTVLYVSEEMDAGDIIVQKTVLISPDDTSGTLAARLAEEGAALLVEALRLLQAGSAPRLAQDPARVTWAPRLTPEDGLIRWSDPAARIVNLIRACDPWPGASTRWSGHALKVWRASTGQPSGRGLRREPGRPDPGVRPAPGTITRVPARDAEPLVVAAGDGDVCVHEVQPPSGRRMSAAAFARGRPLRPGAVLG